MADGKRQTDCAQQKRGIIDKSNGTAPYSDHQLVKPVCFQRLALRKRCKRRAVRARRAPCHAAVGRQLAPLCRADGATFIIDDHVALVDAIGADGVHLGKNDMPVAEARRILGRDKIIGATANTFDDIEALRHLDIDYIGLGPYRFTTTKQRLSPVLGIDGYRRIMQQMKDASINIPVVAIGGITYDDIPSLMDSGVRGIAVSGSLINADNTTAETQKMITLLEEIIQKKLQ